MVLEIDRGDLAANTALLDDLRRFEAPIADVVPEVTFETRTVRTRVIARRPANGRAIEDEAGFPAAREWIDSRLVSLHGVLSQIALELDS